MSVPARELDLCRDRRFPRDPELSAAVEALAGKEGEVTDDVGGERAVESLLPAPVPVKASSLFPDPPDIDGRSAGPRTVFFFKPDVSQTRTVWSKLADPPRSSLGWKLADMQ